MEYGASLLFLTCFLKIFLFRRMISFVLHVKAITWIDEGMVKRIRGVTFSTRVSVQFENTMIHAARGIFNRLLPDVHISTDHKAGSLSGK